MNFFLGARINSRKIISEAHETVQKREPFVLNIEDDLVRTFKNLFDYLNLLLTNPDLATEMLQNDDEEPDPKVRSLIDKFIKLKHELAVKGIDYSTVSLVFRYVVADDITTEMIIDVSQQHGGKNPNSRKPWIHASNRSHIKEIIDNNPKKPGVILVYDRSKLTSITPDDFIEFPQEVYYHGMKPIEGYTLNDALLGMIVVPAIV